VKLVAVALLLFLVIGGATALFLLSTVTTAEMTPAVKTIGVSTPVSVKLTNPHGVRRVSVYLEQNGARSKMIESILPTRRFFPARHVPPSTLAFQAGTCAGLFLVKFGAHLLPGRRADRMDNLLKLRS